MFQLNEEYLQEGSPAGCPSEVCSKPFNGTLKDDEELIHDKAFSHRPIRIPLHCDCVVPTPFPNPQSSSSVITLVQKGPLICGSAHQLLSTKREMTLVQPEITRASVDRSSLYVTMSMRPSAKADTTLPCLQDRMKDDVREIPLASHKRSTLNKLVGRHTLSEDLFYEAEFCYQVPYRPVSCQCTVRCNCAAVVDSSAAALELHRFLCFKEYAFLSTFSLWGLVMVRIFPSFHRSGLLLRPLSATTGHLYKLECHEVSVPIPACFLRWVPLRPAIVCTYFFLIRFTVQAQTPHKFWEPMDLWLHCRSWRCLRHIHSLASCCPE